MNHRTLLLAAAALTPLIACVEPNPPGLLPVVQYEAPVNCYVGQEVVFDASASYDPDGTLVAWGFDFGDGSPALRGDHPVASHAWTRPGTYWTSVTVIDARGNKSTDLRELVVADPASGAQLRCQSDRPFCPPFFECDPTTFRCGPSELYCDPEQPCPDLLSCLDGLCVAP